MTTAVQGPQLQASVPTIWPPWEFIVGLAGPAAVLNHWPPALLDDAHSVCGILTGLNAAGVAWLGDWIRGNQSRICRLTLVLWPACPTTETDLRHLRALVEEFGPRVEFRLLLADRWIGLPPNVVLVVPKGKPQEAVIILGPATGWLLDAPRPEQLAFIWQPDTLLLNGWRSWFDSFWAQTAPLSDASVDLPALVPARGSPDAAVLWDAYVSACEAARSAVQAVTICSSQLSLDPELEAVRVSESKPRSVTAEIGLPPRDELSEWLACLYGQGALVTIDKAGQIPPLDAPIQPRWFGVESLRQIGTVSRRIEYRISPFDRDTLKQLNNKRNGLNDILDRFTYSLAHGVHWMPDAVRPMFLNERERIEAEAKALFGDVVTGDISQFLTGQRERILADADRLYQEFHPGGRIPENVVDEIIDDLTQRLGKAKRESFLPTVSYSRIQPASAADQAGVSEWGQHLTFLLRLARFPRQAITNPYFWRGIRVDDCELLRAMNIAGDSILEKLGSRATYDRARRELERLSQIEESQIDERSKCQKIVDMLTGDGCSQQAELGLR